MQGALFALLLSIGLGANAAWAQDDVVGCCDVGCCDGCGDIGCGGTCGSTCHIYAGAEVSFLKPHLGALGFSATGHPDAMILPTFDYEASPRFWIGFEDSSGLGLRAIYWQIDESARMDMWHADDIAGMLDGVYIDGIGVDLEAETLDLEVTQRGCLGCLELAFAGGVRYGRMQTGLFVDGEIVDLGDFRGGVATEFEGVGPTLALDARRPLGCYGLSLVGGIRGAWLYGCTDGFLTGDATELIDVTITAEDHLMQVYEANLGVEYSCCLSGGCQMSVAAVWESQVWEWAPVAGLIHQDIGLTGPAISVSFVR
jgi:hypothetical protein